MNLSLSISLELIVYLFSSILFSLSIFLFFSFSLFRISDLISYSFDLTFLLQYLLSLLTISLFLFVSLTWSQTFNSTPSLYFRLLFSLSFLLISVSSVLLIPYKLTLFLSLFTNVSTHDDIANTSHKSFFLLKAFYHEDISFITS